MKKFVTFAMLVGAGLLVVGPSRAADSGKFSVHGEIRARYEFSSNTLDAQDEVGSGTALDDDVDFFPYRVRVGVTGEFAKDVVGHIEIQNNGVFGGQFPVGNFGSADDTLLQAFRADFGTSETVLYQGFVDLKNIGGSNFSLRVGRAEHTLGNELQMGDLDFFNGLTFDGIRATWNSDRWNVNGFYYNVGEGNVSINGILASGLPNGGDEDIIFWGAHARFDIGDDGQYIEPYILNKDDNIGANGPFGFLDQHQVYTLGALWARPVTSRDQIEDGRHWDWSAEAAIQSGDYDENMNAASALICPNCDIQGTVFEGWLGYNWAHGSDAHSRIHAGLFLASGDDTPGDTDLEAYLPLFPDIHAHNRLGDTDLFGVLGANIVSSTASSGISFAGLGFSNITDYNIGYAVTSGNHHFAFDVHQLQTTEDIIIGPLAENDIGTEFDVKYGFDYSSNVAVQVGIANLTAGDLLDDLTAPADADDILRAWGQLRLRF
ncbi:MAG: alginate export family protein [Acidobacteriota bacterium]